MNAQVHQLAEARAYSEAQFDCEREDIRKTYGDSGVEAKALGEQALAALFYRSGWTQEQLAKKEGCKRVVVSYRLTFGRFLAFVTSGDIPRNLTERRFRGYWQRTEGSNERQRFAAVAKLIQEDIRVGASTSSKPAVGKALREQFADGAWHRVPTMARHVGASTEDVVAVLNIMRDHGSYGCHCERKQVGKERHYRIVKGASKRIDVQVLQQELQPILDGLFAEGQKNAATFSPVTVSTLARQIEQLVERLAK